MSATTLSGKSHSPSEMPLKLSSTLLTEEHCICVGVATTLPPSPYVTKLLVQLCKIYMLGGFSGRDITPGGELILTPAGDCSFRRLMNIHYEHPLAAEPSKSKQQFESKHCHYQANCRN